ncbi:hypothetical protein [Evtepia gabavorous]|uniref:hypothetical protein n=1 Tax=Evtepia gabavorous TaxID=2211183 RepID=UPI003A931F99
MDNASTAAVSSVIMTDVMIYVVGSLLIIALLDFYALKKIGDKRRPAYQELKVHKAVTLLIVGGFTLVIGVLCMFKDLTVSRYTLTYFGLPYFLALVYYMVKIFRRVRSEERRRRF